MQIREYGYDGTPCSGKIPDLLTSSELYLSLYMQQYFINPIKYDTPLVYYSLKNDYFLLDPNIQKKFLYYFGNAVISSDFGWIFENIDIRSSLSINNVALDININDNKDITLAAANIYFGKLF